MISVRRPSPALVISCVALALALGGTSFAAVSALPKNSVGTAQLKASAVTSAKVKNRSLLRADFASGQLPAGPAGPTGPIGPAGPAGPAGLSGLERVDTTSASNSGERRRPRRRPVRPASGCSAAGCGSIRCSPQLSVQQACSRTTTTSSVRRCVRSPRRRRTGRSRCSRSARPRAEHCGLAGRAAALPASTLIA